MTARAQGQPVEVHRGATAGPRIAGSRLAAHMGVLVVYASTHGHTGKIAGRIAEGLHHEYNVFTRTLMRLMMRRGGHPTDTSHDYDYTDWDAVERVDREFAALVAGRNLRC